MKTKEEQDKMISKEEFPVNTEEKSSNSPNTVTTENLTLKTNVIEKVTKEKAADNSKTRSGSDGDLSKKLISKIDNQPEPYTPDWESLDSRPLPNWYDQSKFGIFIHWGVYSVPAFGDEWFYQKLVIAKNPVYEEFMKKNFPSNFTYSDFAPKFTAEFFEPQKWANLFKQSGAKYVVLTSKHHDGYALWPSKRSPQWNSVDIGPKRDLVGDLAEAIRGSTDLKFGLYHSLMEWTHPLFKEDQDNKWSSQEFVKSKLMPDLHDLVEKYKPSVAWSDGDWDAPAEYWNSTQFLSWLYNESPVKDEVVTNDRWGKGINSKHGGIFTGADRYNPGLSQAHKWENCFTIDKKSWGYRRNADLSEYFTTFELITTLVTTVSGGGNLLLNIGPTSDGMISPIFEQRLLDIGKWLSINGDAIYSTTPWKAQNDTKTANVWYTQGPDDQSVGANPVYATILSWPDNNEVELSLPKVGPHTKVSFLGYPDGDVQWEKASDAAGIRITLPPKYKVKSEWAWVLRLDNLIEI